VTFAEWLGRLSAWLRRDELERALDAEMREHLHLLQQEFVRQGLSAEEARRAAHRKLGNVAGVKEESRREWGFPRLEIVLRDLRYAMRGLARSPGFTISVVLTLALGIGANAAMFGVIDRLMFRPYPMLREPESVRRVYLQTTFNGRRNTNMVFPYQRFLDLSRDRERFAAYAAVSEWRLAVGSGDAVRVRKVAGVSASLWGFFDASPALGRYFAADEDQTPRGTDVAVISHSLWQSEYAGRDVVNTRLKVGRIEYTIIGVTPAGFVGTVSSSSPDVFVPITTIPANLGQWPEEPYLGIYNWDWTEMLVRLAPGVPEDAADAVLTDLYKQSRSAARAINPRVLADSLAQPAAIARAVKTAGGPEPGRESRVLLWVSGVSLIVLVIACASVANLMIARLARRRREITLRLALGVSRARLVAQFITESVLLSLLAAAGGLLIAQWSGIAIRRLTLPEGSPFELWEDPRTMLFALALALLCAGLTALGPVVLAGRSDLASMLRGGTREAGGRRTPLQSVLLVTQIALSVVLLTGAGLFVRSFEKAREIPLGYDAAPVIEVVLDYRGNAIDDSMRTQVRERLLRVARETPGVEEATAVNSRLFATNTQELRVEGIDSVAALGRFNSQITTPEYFRVMRTRILRGRGLEASDRAGAPQVVVVSNAMANLLWPGKDALGQCIRIGISSIQPIETAPCTTVVGIAEDAAQQELGDEARLMYYLPLDAFPLWRMSTFYVRTRGADVRAMLEPVRLALTREMPGDGLVIVRPLQEVLDNQMRSWRLGALLFLTLGVLAFVVAAVGLYGVMAYGVAGRVNELGVRLALGASPSGIVGLVVREGIVLSVVGCTIGAALALAASRWVEPLLFRQSAQDPLVLGVVVAAMLGVAVAASVIPARRAAAVDPMTALRAE
jgi:putative ABC transport system permease protein